MARTYNDGVLSGSLSQIQEHAAYISGMFAVIGLALVTALFAPFTVAPMADAGTGLFSTADQLFDFTRNSTTYIVTYAMGASAIGAIGAYIADPVTGQMVAGKLSPSEMRDHAREAVLEVLAGSYFILVPTVKMFDAFGLWTNYAGTTPFAFGTVGVGVAAIFAVIYYK